MCGAFLKEDVGSAHSAAMQSRHGVGAHCRVNGKVSSSEMTGRGVGTPPELTWSRHDTVSVNKLTWDSHYTVSVATASPNNRATSGDWSSHGAFDSAQQGKKNVNKSLCCREPMEPVRKCEHTECE